jgi:CRP/FNR family cyclic AMP-dependent transcriptional regulator
MSGNVKFPLLELLPEADRAAVMSGLKMLKFDAGQTIHERGVNTDVFFIFEGKIRVDMQDQHGNVAFFDYRLPGMFIGWFSACSGLAQPLATTASEKCLLGRMPGAEFMGMICARPELSRYMHKFNCELLILYALRISNLIVRDPLRRVAAEIIDRAKSETIIEVPSRVDWASRLGMTRPTLSKRLSELRRRGLIRIEGDRIEILDARQLAELIG